MSDRIFITGLMLHAHHGVMPHEAKVGQTFSIDLVPTKSRIPSRTTGSQPVRRTPS